MVVTTFFVLCSELFLQRSSLWINTVTRAFLISTEGGELCSEIMDPNEIIIEIAGDRRRLESMRDAVLDTQDLCARTRSTVQASQELLRQVDDLYRSNVGPVLHKNKLEYSSGSFIYRDPLRLIELRATLRPDVPRACGQRLQLAMFSALTLWRSGGRRSARIVPILHALLEESIARLALQSLLFRTELAGRHFLLCTDCKTRPRRQEHNQSGSKKRATRHDESPGSPRLETNYQITQLHSQGSTEIVNVREGPAA